MVTVATIARIGTAIGEPSRAAMLYALMDGRALTAGELSRAAGVAPSTGSDHLSILTGLGLVACVQQGRHRYHRLRTPEIARLLESMMVIGADEMASTSCRPVRTGPRDAEMRFLRTCYDHLAGGVAVAMAEAMVRQNFLTLTEETGHLSSAGIEFLRGLGWSFPSIGPSAQLSCADYSCRSCLDWSERRPHIGGRFGAELYKFALKSRWVMSVPGSRALRLTPRGARVLETEFAISPARLMDAGKGVH
ncbi:ArsR family transcriptional regulator [Qipengyuania sp. 6B39]|uniref:ArsR/SmtB family transcription factor n=1 Tax=Qipengyuania proteolytica TaxID=2867239 RepID=UPI001C8AAD75|nr:ArsR family transcriptional regulator [Qipengyuania proteolytica]